MEVAAPKVAAKWREAGRWWDGEPYREYRLTAGTGPKGEVVREMPCVGDALARASTVAFVENRVGGVDARFVKMRDEKVALALGTAPASPPLRRRRADASYALLHACSGYAFGRGAMLAEEVPAACAARGVAAALLADPFSVAGAVEFSRIAAAAGVRPLLGASFVLEEGGEIVLVARNRTGWRSLCRLITDCHRDEPRLFPLATWERLEHHAEGLLLLTGGHIGPLARLAFEPDPAAPRRFLERAIALYGRDGVAIQIERSYCPWEISLEGRLLRLAGETGVLAVAGGLVTHAARSDFPAQDVLVCAHTLCGVEEIVGRKPTRHPTQPHVPEPPARAMNAERFVRTPEEMMRLFADRPDLVENTRRIVERCEPEVLPGRAELPSTGPDEPQRLRRLVWSGARERYGWLAHRRDLERRIERELGVIVRLGFSGHFLIAAEMCAWADERGIAMSGRGSVVDSVAAYCLGLSRIDAHAHGLAFERFLPDDGTKRPDIDIDFEAGRREEVRQHLADLYGRDRVATVGAYGAFSTRGIVREVGKAMGIPPESLAFLAKRLHGGVSPKALEDALDKRPELRDSGIPRERFRWVFRLAERLTDVPRGLRAHPCGVVLSRDPIRDFVPVVPSAVPGVELIQWDKRSAKRCFDKFDVLCLRALDILSHAQTRIRSKDPFFDERAIPTDDPATFATMRRGELVGITQSASPAMTAAHVRVRTASLSDAALVQACIRPGVGGAIKNDLLVARKFGAPYALEHPDMEPIVGKTYGIVVFQEQVDALLMRFAGYSQGEAEEIREGIYKRRRENYVQAMREEIVARVAERYDPALAETIYDLVAPYQGYGFAEGHALAFAETTIRSLWTKGNHPAEFFASALEAQPAGYYPAATLANEARIHGVTILPLDVNASGLSYSVEDVTSDGLRVPNGGVRLPLTRVEGVSRVVAERIVAGRSEGLYCSLSDLARRIRPDEDELANLVLAGGFDRLHPNRRAALWGVAGAVAGSRARSGPLVSAPSDAPFEDVEDLLPAERGLLERRLLGLDVERHLMAFERARVRSRGGVTTAEARGSFVGREVSEGVFGTAPSQVRGSQYREGMGPPHPSGERRGNAVHSGSPDLRTSDRLSRARASQSSGGWAGEKRNRSHADDGRGRREYVAREPTIPGGVSGSRGGDGRNRSAPAFRGRDGAREVMVVGNPMRLRMPPTRSGRRVVFFDLEDETGLLNLTVFDDVYRRDGHALVTSAYVVAWATPQDRQGHAAFLVRRIIPYEPRFGGELADTTPLPLRTADFLHC